MGDGTGDCERISDVDAKHARLQGQQNALEGERPREKGEAMKKTQ